MRRLAVILAPIVLVFASVWAVAQDLIEYALVIALISIGAFAGLFNINPDQTRTIEAALTNQVAMFYDDCPNNDCKPGGKQGPNVESWVSEDGTSGGMNHGRSGSGYYRAANVDVSWQFVVDEAAEDGHRFVRNLQMLISDPNGEAHCVVHYNDPGGDIGDLQAWYNCNGTGRTLVDVPVPSP